MRRRVGRAGPVAEEELLADVEQVRHAVDGGSDAFYLVADGFILRVAHHLAARAAVACHPRVAVREGDARAVAVVRAEGADEVRLLRIREGVERIEGEGARACGLAPLADCVRVLQARRDLAPLAAGALQMLLCKQRDADGAHEPRVGRARDLAADVLLERAQHGVV